MPIKSKLPDISIPENISLPDFLVKNFHNTRVSLLIDPFTKESFTCQQASIAINKVSAGLYKKGLRLGDVVALCSPNSIWYPILLFGILKIGGIAAPFNPLQTADELTHLTKDSGAKFFITVPQIMEKVKEVLRKVGTQVQVIVVGDTSFTQLIGNDGKIYGIIAIACLMFYLSHTMVVMAKFDIQSYLKFIQEYKATKLAVVPPIFLLLAKDPSVLKYDTSSVRAIGCGAAPLGHELTTEVQARFPNALIWQAFGMTEIMSSHMMNVFTIVPGSCGQLLPNMSMKIVDVESGNEVGLGKPGEVWLKGPNVMRGYRNNPSATSQTIDSEGYLHTGDIGYMDANQNLFIVDRLKELIKYKGFQVAPAELEALLVTHPNVADVAVVGKQDLEAGELPVAFVVLKEGHKVTDKEIVAWAEKRTAPYKKLRGGVLFVDTIPKSPSGKILRRHLRAKL